jgi:Fe-S oxidoreductase
MNNLTERKKKALAILSEPKDNRVVTYLNSCVHCGLCAESCIYYLKTNDKRFIPARKVELVSSLYKKYCTLTGKFFPRLLNAQDWDDTVTSEMIEQFL